MSDLPKATSVDDHVVEPSHVWQDRLPSRMRKQGPRVECAWRSPPAMLYRSVQ